MGRGHAPSEAQIQLWHRVEDALEQLLIEARTSSKKLLVGAEADLFVAAELELKEVRFESDQSVILFFSFPREEEVWMWPMVTFKDLKSISTEWTV